MVGAAAGVVVGLIAAVVLIAGGSFDGRLTPVPVPDASNEFIAAFQRSLTGTYVVEADYTRTLPDGRALTSRTFVAQRPPDSIRRQFGSISGTVAGRVVSCSNEVGGTMHCGPSAVAPDSAQAVQQALDNLRSYFAPPALYGAVAAGPDCFKLTQLRPSSVLPYGSSARFCFDPDTGAIRVLSQHLDGATDTFEATLVRGDVTAADFDLSQNNDFGTQADGVDGAEVPASTTTTQATPTGGPAGTTGG